jgi:hypothetical protein
LTFSSSLLFVPFFPPVLVIDPPFLRHHRDDETQFDKRSLAGAGRR